MAKNIVILTMRLDIGGAETHIVELAMALKNKGHNVTVFSNGGVYVATLEAHGIPHILAPMNDKKPSSLYRSKKILTKYCKTHRVSVIHSHTRITNYIAGGICRKFRIPLVTTVHFNFRVNLLTKAFSRWGQRALSVSEDLKDYVVDNYGFDPAKVRVTVNGTNLETFCAGTNPELRAKYGLTDQHKVILCVSRIDLGACENVFRFLESAEEIYRACPETRIVIVGGGNRFEQLKETARAINAVTADNYITLAGAQSNIADFCRMADVFSGVSRSALEAMACRLPTILVGNSGYLGVYSDDIRQACIDTNFTCRGYDYVSPHEVAKIAIGMIRCPQDYASSVEAAHKLIEEHYSVDAMASDALASYEEAQSDLRPCDLMISGYYGTRNFGDDTTLRAILHNVDEKRPLRRVCILSHTTENRFEDPRITILHRFDLRRILPMMKKTKLFILGGGSLLQDVTSNRSIFYYLFMMRHAQRYGCKTMIYGNGIGPVTREHHRRSVCGVLKKADCITLRDRKSYDFLIKCGFTPDEICLTADETYCYRLPASSEDPVNVPRDKKMLLINLRAYGKQPGDLSPALSGVLNTLCEAHGLYPVLMPVQFRQDHTPLKSLSEKLRIPHHLFTRDLSDREIVGLIRQSDYLLTERLHPVIFAARLQTPFAAIVYDPKVSAAAESLGMSRYVIPLADADEKNITDVLEQMIRDAGETRERLRLAVAPAEASAAINSDLAAALIDR